MRHRLRPAAGFTLIEVLVALVLLTLFAVTSYRALNAILEAERHARQETARWQRLATAFARIEADLQDAAPLPAATGKTRSGFAAAPAESATPGFSLTRRLPDDVQGGIEEVHYGFRAGSLSRWVVSPWLPQTPQAEAATPIMTGLATIAFRYMDATGQWQAAWAAEAEAPPRAVEVVLAWPDGRPLRRVFRTQ